MVDGIRITKMSGAGNDFLVLGPEASAGLPSDLRRWVRAVCRRGLSVGADGVLFVEPVEPGRVRVRFLNPDGSVAFCGNGTRCAARFAHLRGLSGPHLVLDTSAGQVRADVDGSSVRLRLPPPRDLGEVSIEADGETLIGRWIDAGSPHFVVFVDRVSSAPLDRWGPAARRHPKFGTPGVNVDLVASAAAGLTLRTWERGVEAETLACGSGAVAAAMAARLTGATDPVRVLPASGIPITIALPGPAQRPRAAEMESDARVIFDATISAEGLEYPGAGE